MHNPAAERLHFLVSIAVKGFLQQLNGRIRGVLDKAGTYILSLKQYCFGMINSDKENKAMHQAAVNFFSEPVNWHDSVGGLCLFQKPELRLPKMDYLLI